MYWQVLFNRVLNLHRSFCGYTHLHLFLTAQPLNINRNHNHNKKSASVCRSGLTLRGATLRGGIMAGEFKSVGVVDTQRECVDMCCKSSKKCDIAMTVGRECINIECFSKNFCNVAPAGNLAVQGRVIPITTFIQKVDPNAVNKRDKSKCLKQPFFILILCSKRFFRSVETKPLKWSSTQQQTLKIKLNF